MKSFPKLVAALCAVAVTLLLTAFYEHAVSGAPSAMKSGFNALSPTHRDALLLALRRAGPFAVAVPALVIGIAALLRRGSAGRPAKSPRADDDL